MGLQGDWAEGRSALHQPPNLLSGQSLDSMACDERASDLVRLDFQFRCNYCIKLIAQDRPVYMRHDLSYCSTSCRSRGRSALYTNLRGLQIERLREIRQAASESATSEIISTVISDSSLASSAARSDRARRGPLGWVLGKVLDVITTRLPDAIVARIPTPLARAASSALMSRMRPGSSLHRLLGYLPKGNSLLGLVECSPRSSQSDLVGSPLETGRLD